MAIGFSMSSVNDILIDPNERAIYFELKNIRYKIIIDNINRAQQLIVALNEMITEAKKEVGSQKPLPDFYKKL